MHDTETTAPTFDTLCQHIEALNDSGALELHYIIDSVGTKQCCLPYIMNDALEYYLILKDCRITGAFVESQEPTAAATFFSDLSWAECIDDGGQTALIVHRQDDTIFTVWFRQFRIARRCYQYHRIGHFWVPGQEQWRRATYILGTIYDKHQYVGDTICNDTETELYPLMEFAPLRLWFPIRSEDPLASDYYDDTARGFHAMEALAREAGDRGYLRLLALYRRTAGIPFARGAMNRLLGHALTRPARQALYDCLIAKIQAASEVYAERDYGPAQNRQIDGQRAQVTARLTAAGFTGTYPLFSKGATQVFAAEEHPFTILEDDKFRFRIQFMVSKPANDSLRHSAAVPAKDSLQNSAAAPANTETSAAHATGLCYGFFRSKRWQSSIVSSLSDLRNI